MYLSARGQLVAAPAESMTQKTYQRRDRKRIVTMEA